MNHTTLKLRMTGKHMLLLSMLLFASGQMLAVSFTGARVKNESGKTIEAQITNWKGAEWTKIAPGKSADLHSEKGDRYIYWRIEGKPNTIYSTKKYSSPDTLTIGKFYIDTKDNNEEKCTYFMSYGILGKDPVAVANKTTQKPVKLAEEPEEPSKTKKILSNILNIVKGVLESLASEIEESFDIARKATTRGQLETAKIELEADKTNIVKQRIESNQKISEVEKNLKKNPDKKTESELKTLRSKLTSLGTKEKQIYDKIKEINKKIDNMSETKLTIKMLKEDIKFIDEELNRLEKLKKEKGKTTLGTETKIFVLNSQKTAKEKEIKKLKK